MKSIFVSSTFRDMQAERDLLHMVVIPEINEFVRKFGQSISFTDLRWGVNTDSLDSQQGAHKVLKKIAEISKKFWFTLKKPMPICYAKIWISNKLLSFIAIYLFLYGRLLRKMYSVEKK